jgi:erythromycin esterase
MRRSFLALLLGLLSLSPALADPRPFLDLGFEAPECTSGWVDNPYLTVFEARPDSSVKQSGQQSLRIQTSPSPVGFAYGSMVQELKPEEWANKHVRLSGFIRTENVTGGFAGLWWYALNASGDLSYADLSANGPSGTTPWTSYAVELDIPADVQTLFFGVEVYGTGTAWFDGLEIEVDGQPWRDGHAPHLPEPSPGDVHWVRDRAIPLATVQAGNGFADLQPLKDILGSSRIVSLGEATHGTREIFQTKHRLLEFLATEMGFTHFAIEANMPEAYKVNEYVLTGVGDPAELLEGMYFWTWNTQEVLDMILWMREFNASGRGRLQFLGFDMQFSQVARANVRSFLARVEPAYIPQANSAFVRILQVEQHIRSITAADVAAIRDVFEHLSARRADYLQIASAEDVDWAIQNARVSLQSAEDLAGITSRDKSMAANVEWILDHAPAGSKIVLWAHNLHVSKRADWMGKYLAERYGDDMYVLGFAFGEGRYNAQGPRGLTSHEALAPVPGSLETLLEATGIPRFLLDLRGENGHSTWFKKPVGLRSIGSITVRCSYVPTVVGEEYDGLIWLNPTSPSVRLPFD